MISPADLRRTADENHLRRGAPTGTYAELTQGNPWYEDQGAGEPLVLIHGRAVDPRFSVHNVGPLAERFRVIAIELWGHGRTAGRKGPLSLESFATDVAELIERVAGAWRTSWVTASARRWRWPSRRGARSWSAGS